MMSVTWQELLAGYSGCVMFLIFFTGKRKAIPNKDGAFAWACFWILCPGVNFVSTIVIACIVVVDFTKYGRLW